MNSQAATYLTSTSHSPAQPLTTCKTAVDALLYPQVSRASVVDQAWERIGVTGNHPIWSEDRHDYVAAMDLRVGERLTNFSGDTVWVQQKLPRPGPTPVYNLEVQDEHVYYVGANGVLAHNAGEECPKSAFHGTDADSALSLLNNRKLDAIAASARKIDGPDGFYMATDLDDAMYFAGHRHKGTVLEIEFSEVARQQLNGSGLVLQPIPGGPRSPNFNGDELFVNPEMYSLFNRLVESGDIRLRPARFRRKK